MISRREFVAAIVASRACLADEEPRTIPVALQLFSVRKQAAADLPGTLARVKQIGFTAVELAGAYGHKGAEIHRYLVDNDLTCCGSHTSFARLQDAQFAATVDFNHAVGNKRVIVPSLPPQYTQTLDGWRSAALAFVELAGRLAGEGLELGYHNHSIEFKPIDGTRPIDIFLRASRSVFLELDLGGAGYAGVNPVQVLETYRRQVKMIHVKDYTTAKPDLLIGTGSMDWPEFFRAAQSSSVDWYVIEHDSASGPDLADIADSYQRFARLSSAS